MSFLSFSIEDICVCYQNERIFNFHNHFSLDCWLLPKMLPAYTKSIDFLLKKARTEKKHKLCWNNFSHHQPRFSLHSLSHSFTLTTTTTNGNYLSLSLNSIFLGFSFTAYSYKGGSQWLFLLLIVLCFAHWRGIDCEFHQSFALTQFESIIRRLLFFIILSVEWLERGFSWN